MIDAGLLDRLYHKADAGRWSLTAEVFAEALEAGVPRAFPGSVPSRRELERHLNALHLGDLALACGCAAGNQLAWEHFIAQHRPVLYRAADALDRTGRAREIADSLYAELYGLREDRDTRGSLFRYFHGRSSLATWLRAVLAQRYVDCVRADRHAAPLDEIGEGVPTIVARADEPDRVRLTALIAVALREAIARLDVKDRLRLKGYYEEELTLAQVGRLTREHEATVSRQLAKARKKLRRDVEHQLRAANLSEADMARAVESIVSDAGPLDLRELFGSARARKKAAPERSK
jgi:RNA polymerase sigma factor (sigma-70 family)